MSDFSTERTECDVYRAKGCHCEEMNVGCLFNRSKRRVTAGEGRKDDAGKAPLSLIPREALLAEAAVLAFGAQKYDRHNWRNGMAWSRVIDAALRHIAAFNDGEDNDPETGLPHLAHARCCLGFIITYAERRLGQDDRHTATDLFGAPIKGDKG